MGDAAQELLKRAAQAYADDDMDQARDSFEAAFQLLDEADHRRAAARVASALASLQGGIFGNEAVGRGWLERARRLLEAEGPCVEHAYVEVARLSCDRPDVDELEAAAERALEIARSFGDVDLEVRALADSVVALVSQGRLEEGFIRFDEVLARLSSGEVSNAQMVGTSLCSLLTSCDRAGDVERALESIRVAEALLLAPGAGRPRVLGTHCHLALGSVLCEVGRWEEAEAALAQVVDPARVASRIHLAQGMARLAELRIHQGRFDEAAALVEPFEDSVEVALPLARLHLVRGDVELATAVLRAALRRMIGDVLRASRVAALLVEAELVAGDREAAERAATLLRSMATAVELPQVTASAEAASARLALAGGDVVSAVGLLESACAQLGDGHHPVLAASIHIDLARAHAAAGDAAAAVAAARAGHAAASRVGASHLVDQAAATLRDLGSTPPRPGRTPDALGGLTTRELDVLAGIQRGDTNAQIGVVLYLSPKTVEHHVGRILAKLGVRTRAEAAAVAARAGAVGAPTHDMG